MDLSLSGFQQYTGYVLAALAVWIALRCARSMLLGAEEPELWGSLELPGGGKAPLRHWECVIGRSRASDVMLSDASVESTHAALQRAGNGAWTVTDLSGKAGTFVGKKRIQDPTPLKKGDRLRLGNVTVRFQPLDAVPRRARPKAWAAVPPAGTLIILWFFQIILMLQHCASASGVQRVTVLLAFALLMAMEWACYFLERSVSVRGFEPEIIGFFLTTVGFSVAATSTPGAMGKQAALCLGGLCLFFLLGFWLRDLERVRATRWAAGGAAVALLGLTLLTSPAIFGAKNWLIVAGNSLQPSEFVKIAYIYAGAATLDRLYRRRNLLLFIGFSAVCVGALALMGDFGTALVFFITFLVISFMRSGSFATVILAVSAAATAVMLVLASRPYVAARFAGWGHVWEDPLGAGYQQVRAMSALASGGLFGRGAGSGWLKDVVAADTDLVFGVVGEELGLIVGVCCVLDILLLALFAVRSASTGRSSYYVIASCAVVTVFMVQMGLNVFGSMDILPFTGVTFPFVSRGGSSLIACWGLLAFIKAGDTRQEGSFALGRIPGKKSGPKAPAGEKKPAGKKPAPGKPAAGKPAEKKPAPKKPAAQKKPSGAGKGAAR